MKLPQEECIDCDGIVIGIWVLTSIFGPADAEFPEVCPHCGSNDWRYDAPGIDVREDFHADG